MNDTEVGQAMLLILSTQSAAVRRTVFKGLFDGVMEPAAAGAVRSASHDGPNKSSTIVLELTETPGMPLGELAKKVYGEDENSGRKLGSLLITLKKAGRIDNPEHGKWIVTEAELKKQRQKPEEE